MTTIGDLIKKKDYDYISYRLTVPPSTSKQTDIFAGCFASKDGEIVSLDGDTYSKEETVLSYEEWKNEEKGIEKGLTVICQGEWIEGELHND